MQLCTVHSFCWCGYSMPMYTVTEHTLQSAKPIVVQPASTPLAIESCGRAGAGAEEGGGCPQNPTANGEPAGRLYMV